MIENSYWTDLEGRLLLSTAQQWTLNHWMLCKLFTMYVCMYIYLQCFYTDGWRMKEKPWSVKTAHADACAQDRRESLWINCCIFHNHSQLTHQREASGQHVRHDHQNTKRGNILCKNGAHTSSRVLGCWSRMFQKVARVLALVYCKMKG